MQWMHSYKHLFQFQDSCKTMDFVTLTDWTSLVENFLKAGTEWDGLIKLLHHIDLIVVQIPCQSLLSGIQVSEEFSILVPFLHLPLKILQHLVVSIAASVDFRPWAIHSTFLFYAAAGSRVAGVGLTVHDVQEVGLLYDGMDFFLLLVSFPFCCSNSHLSLCSWSSRWPTLTRVVQEVLCNFDLTHQSRRCHFQGKMCGNGHQLVLFKGWRLTDWNRHQYLKRNLKVEFKATTLIISLISF